MSKIKFQHLRNATSKIFYAGKIILIDPMLGEKGRYDGFPETINSHQRNPTAELPQSVAEILSDVDAIILTHTHLDHWDEVAVAEIPKNIQIFTQNSEDMALLKTQGFTKITPILEKIEWENITISKTGGAHGTTEMFAIPQLAVFIGDAMGFVLQSENQPTIYFAGDTIWTADVPKALHKYQPEIVVANMGAVKLEGFEGALILGNDDVEKIHQILPNAKIVAVHLEAVNHGSVSRADILETAQKLGISEKVFAPKDGEVLAF